MRCPKCGSGNILTERRLDGFHACLECLYRWKIGESQPRQTVFDRITASPKVLAPTYVFKEWDQFSEMFCWRSLLIKEDVKFASQSEAVKATIDVLCGE